MKPEKQEVVDSDEAFVALGVPKERVEPLKALGYTTIEKLKAVEKPGKLHQEMMGYRKKYKLEIVTVTVEDVSGWLKTE